MDKKQQKKALRRNIKKEEKTIKESFNIAKFITAVSSKNYASANKYLRSAVEQKLQQRIAQAVNQPLF